ncbi:A/G-specific adenine glycosylase [Rubinisphaera margarita]|uniref:A/G-specific adenine glycosylase n=1 Tax=Rubinisphaera margarita TaxID=2909586 RepID=UPI001EE88ABF|nr:A/G-specific adenine glycosylase [Rubinisphaera margarita]MCG6157602.1 A/G-specific adenine glycosylase [Rubinisphaera margarita]
MTVNSADSETNLFEPATLKSFRADLKRWYRKAGRELPWRLTADPYRIWLSEIMLQQTTVAAVIPYYERFLARFPDVPALAAAEEAEVLRLWEGLGYYSRARNIHKTARIVAEERKGEFPRSAAELHELPGIGRYTAGAIASFAYDLPAPILEANTQRLYARLLAYDAPLQSTASQRTLWNFAEQLVPKREPGLFNQALMELGGQICKPVDPLCDDCPVSRHCRAFEQQRQHEIPHPKKKIELTDVVHLCVAVKQDDRFLVRQYSPEERWAGLWDFLRWEQNDFPILKRSRGRRSSELFTDQDLFTQEFARAEALLRERYQLPTEIQELALTIKHGVTRYRITLLCLVAEFGGDLADDQPTDQQWVTRDQLKELPLSKTGRQFANHLLNQ